MEDISTPPGSSIPQKRPAAIDSDLEKKPLNLKGTQFVFPTPPDTEESSNASSKGAYENQGTSRAISPAPSSSTLSSIESVSADTIPKSSTDGQTAVGNASGQPPAKRVKLTPAQKLEKHQAKTVKDQERLEQKARREEEKRVKDEEKRVKDEEKRKKAEEREAKRREKELEEERKAQEKLKKERSQMRLGIFFQQNPTTPIKNGTDGDDEARVGTARRKSLSLEPFDNVANQIRVTVSPAKDATTPRASEKNATVLGKDTEVSDYHKAFLPFEAPSHTTLAPMPSLKRKSDELEAAQEVFDRELSDPSIQEKYDLGIVESYASLHMRFGEISSAPRGATLPNMRQLVDQIQGGPGDVIDLTTDVFAVTPLEQLREVSVRHLHFNEDVRPAYCGTYTKIQSPTKTNKMRKNPFSRVRTDTNYDYDSEAEWEEPEEGDEDLLSDEEDEVDEVGDTDDIEAFLDDEDDTGKNKRKMITGDLVPSSTGLCWEGQAGRIISNVGNSDELTDFSSMNMCLLISGLSRKSIDPFSTSYWQVDSPPSSQAVTQINDTAATTVNSLMAPPRQPLQPRPNCFTNADHGLVGAAKGEKGPITSVSANHVTTRGPKSAPKTLSKEDLEEFKEAVVGSPLGKLDLQKGLKCRYVIAIPWKYLKSSS